MKLTIQASPEVARTFSQSSPPTPHSQEILKSIGELGGTLQPMHPKIDDPQLMRYFTIDVSDLATANQLMARLSGSQGIEAVYLKPADELP
jgi:hypothetical protein